ncbi:MAG: serine hydrolase domain-containing protein [Candidatus Dormibacteria bacterium]
MGLAEGVRDQVTARTLAAQAEHRLPSLVVAISEAGEMLHQVAVGRADVARSKPAATDVQYRIGSITKTFTALAILQLVAEGRLDLQGPLSQGWPGAPDRSVTLADLLCHGSGMQREPDGGVWEVLEFPRADQLAEVTERGRALYPAGSWFHYSNLAYALLGELVAQVTKSPWEDYVRTRILGPLGMSRTTMAPDAPPAQGYSVAPYTDEVLLEAPIHCQGLSPAAQLWSTAEDLCRWSGALGGSRPEVVPDEILTQMSSPRVVADLVSWRRAFGLGLMLLRDGDVIYQGHLGSMPGFLAAVLCHPKSRLGVVVLTNTTAGLDLGALAVELLSLVRSASRPTEWVPGEAAPARIVPLLGRWWSEWSEWLFRWTDGHLEATVAGGASDSATRFAELAPDEFIAVSGQERGEKLVVVREPGRAGGAVEKLYWATYPFTREPQPFGPARRP